MSHVSYQNVENSLKQSQAVSSSLRYFQDISRIFLGYLQDISRIFLGYVQDISRIFPGYFQDISRIFLQYFQDISRIFLGYFQDISRTFLGYFQNISRTFQGYFKDIILEYFGDISGFHYSKGLWVYGSMGPWVYMSMVPWVNILKFLKKLPDFKDKGDWTSLGPLCVPVLESFLTRFIYILKATKQIIKTILKNSFFRKRDPTSTKYL